VVYDNSLTTGMNIIEGTRGKINFMHYEALGNADKSFSQVRLTFVTTSRFIKRLYLR
jgi:hypothetical protein